MDFDFSGWATRNNVRCSDGRTIIRNAFAENDGNTVPLVWSHQHSNPLNVLGHALLENREDGVYAYCTFNDSEYGKAVKAQVLHGDITQLSIYANHLKERGGDVIHGDIKEVSLVIAGANPEAYIDSVISHSEDEGEAAIIYTGENFDSVLAHTDEDDKEKNKKIPDKDETAKDKPETEESNKTDDESGNDNEKTIKDVLDTLNGEQKKVVYGLLAQAFDSENPDDSTEDNPEKEKEPKTEHGGKEMKHNLFEGDDREGNVLSHADQESILAMAKSNSVGSLQAAIERYRENNNLAHSIDSIETLFPDYRDLNPGAPEAITRDQSWVSHVIDAAHKSPIARIRTRQMDARSANFRGLGYKKGSKKDNTGNIKLIKRTTDPQTVFIKDALNRDDVIDITDFDVVEYQYRLMRGVLNEEVATAIMIGDGREDGDENKIAEDHIRPIWKDDDLYTIHADVDLDDAKKRLQGTNTSANFSENYVYAEAIIEAALYAREQYKGSGSLEFYCAPHILNVMLLARDLNGRRIYSSKADLAAALNVKDIIAVEQFEGQVRTTSDISPKKKELLGLFVNIKDYVIGATKGGEITRFNQFDIDFNLEKLLIETRLSGALARIKSAIALEKDVTSVDAA